MIRWLTGRWIRKRWAAVLPFLLLVAVGTAGTVVTVGAGFRTARAYSEYLERADVGDVVVNP